MKSWILGAACGALIWVCGCGSQSSDSAGDGGGNAPAILSQPASQTVLAGKTISFSVVATGAEPVAY